jgi:hypothetical protein
MVRIEIEKPLYAKGRMGELEVMENCGFSRLRMSQFPPFQMIGGKGSQGVCKK